MHEDFATCVSPFDIITATITTVVAAAAATYQFCLISFDIFYPRKFEGAKYQFQVIIITGQEMKQKSFVK